MNKVDFGTPGTAERDSRHQFTGDEKGNDGSFALDLERYWHEALGLKYWLAGIIALGILLGILATLLATPLYKATSRLEVSQVTADVTNLNSLEAEGLVSELQYLNTQYELLVSQFMAKRVLEAGNLSRDEAFLEAFNLDEEVNLTRSIEKVLLENVSIEPITQSSLVDVTFSSPNPAVSAEIANLWAQEFVAANYEKRFGANIEARDFLQSQIAELRERLAQSERELVEYANANEILVLNAGGESGTESAEQTLVGADLQALNAALADAVADRVSAQAAVVAGEFPGNDPRNELLTRLSEAKAELAVLRSNFGPDYPEVVEKQAEVSSLNSAIKSGAGDSLQGARLREAELRRQMEEAKRRFLGQQGQGIKYGILKREVDTNREIYAALLQRFKELEASGAGQNNIQIIDIAAVPVGPYAPSLVQNLLISLVASLVLAAGLVYLKVTMSQTLQDPEDVRKRLGLALLGAIPRNAEGSIIERITERSSEINEAYTTVRTNLNLLTPQGAPKVLMFTSSVPAEGKTISSVGVATSFAQLGKRTLLIDADLRNSKLRDTLAIDNYNQGGLVSLLASQETDIFSQIVSLEEFGFDFLPMGQVPPNPVELLAGDKFAQVIEATRGDYDQVLIDGAPMLALADAIEMSKGVDGVIFVIETEKIKLRGIENALGRLMRSGAQVYGAIVTKVSQKNSAYGYGYGYGYGDEERLEKA
jgi:capsular exopolysaccharide synthesis family protein